MTDRRVFGAYSSALREEKGYSLEQVCEGLCTAQRLYQLETGQQSAGKLLQDAILERLGVGAEDYEHYLHSKEYAHWEMRQRILWRISCGETARARELLETYRVQYGGDVGSSPCTDGSPRIASCEEVGKRLERQFYLVMWAQIRYLEGAEAEEMGVILEEAVQLTIPGLWEKPLRGRALSLKEWNLILEAERYRTGSSLRPDGSLCARGGEEAHYREILACLEEAPMDLWSKAKTYPKAVCLLWRCVEEKGGETGEELFGLCDRALEILRKTSRMYWLWELLELRGRYLAHRMEELEGSAEGCGKGGMDFDGTYRENEGWKKALEAVYAEYGVPRETFHFCYLYQEKGVYCINDVVRIRRNMLGIGVAELCEGVCDIKTLRRLEREGKSTQRAIVQELFERLGLPMEMVRTELVTESPEAREMVEKLRWYENEREPQKGELLLAWIRKKVSTEIRCNRQSLMRKELNLLDAKGEISREEYRRRLQDALELTLPFGAFLQEGEKYLTHEEQSCIQNMMQKMDKESKEFTVCMERFEEMYHPVAEGELLGNVSSIYSLVMGYVGSELGNRGRFDESDWYGERMVREELCSRRMVSIKDGLYNRWWNYKERKRCNLPTDRRLDGEGELGKCIQFSRLTKCKFYETFYREMAKEEGYHCEE